MFKRILLGAIVISAVMAITALASAAVLNKPAPATEVTAAKICFPAKFWNADSEDRPCDVITRPQEDGSGRLILGTLGASSAVCVIPNPYEERGDFVIKCNRVSNK